jgi:membrane-associated phospholipid phosphatase/dolichol kinase
MVISIDFFSKAIAALDNPILTTLSVAADPLTYITLFIVAVWLFFFKYKKDKRKKDALLLSILLLFVAVQSIKFFMPQQRPCSSGIESKIDCPNDSAFPSAHAAFASLFLLPFISSIYFIPYALFVAFVAFSRIYVGVHSVVDVSAGLMFGIAACLIADRFVSKNAQKAAGKQKPGELARQITHIIFGVISLAIILFFFSATADWRALASLFFSMILVALLFVVFLMNFSVQIPLVSRYLRGISIRDSFAGEAALWYVLGVLLLLTFLNNFQYIVGSLMILTLGDSISTIFASQSRKTSIFKNKTPGSFFAFVAFSLPATLFIGPSAIPLIVVCAIVESIDLKIDDNFLIPLVCALYLSFIQPF